MQRQWIHEVASTLQPLADPQRAVTMAAYMKNHFPFLGIATPARRAALKPLISSFSGDLLAAADALWALREREYQYAACDLLRHHMKRLDSSDLAGLEALVQRKSWWDSVDGIAPIMGNIVYRERPCNAHMDRLIGAENLWLRRVALIHQLAWKQETDRERLFAYCLRCADEEEFFIRKAIGWALRQYAWTDPDAVREFLQRHRDMLSPLSIREASKHLHG